MKPIAVQGCMLEQTPSGGVATIVTPPSIKVKAEGKGCYNGILTVSISEYTGGAIDVPGSGAGTGTIVGTSSKVMIDSQPAVLEGDQGIVTVNGLKYVGTSTTKVAQPVTVRISSAGQMKVFAE